MRTDEDATGNRALLLRYGSLELLQVLLITALDFRHRCLLFLELAHDRIVLFPQPR
jgi:hypothetical protein